MFCSTLLDLVNTIVVIISLFNINKNPNLCTKCVMFAVIVKLVLPGSRVQVYNLALLMCVSE